MSGCGGGGGGGGYAGGAGGISSKAGDGGANVAHTSATSKNTVVGGGMVSGAGVAGGDGSLTIYYTDLEAITATKVTVDGSLSYAGTEVVTNAATGNTLANEAKSATISAYSCCWATSFAHVTASNGKTYTFGYTYGGQDFIARRDDTTKTWTLVTYMYGGGKPGENNGFAASNLSTMAWGTSASNSAAWQKLLQADTYYATVGNILLMP